MKMQIQRRQFLSRVTATGLFGLIVPKAFAAWPKTDFSITEYEKAIQQLTGGKQLIAGKVTLEAPKIAENGAQVRVEVQTDLPNVKAINLLVEKNPVPLISRFLIGKNNLPYAAINLKVRETSELLAIVEADDKFYSASREVQVTAGGCG